MRFQRQKIIGKYIADFYCAKAKLVIEIDGSQHYEDVGLVNDEKRTEYLMQYGISVIRISNREIWENFSGVCEKIHLEVEQSLSQLR